MTSYDCLTCKQGHKVVHFISNRIGKSNIFVIGVNRVSVNENKRQLPNQVSVESVCSVPDSELRVDIISSFRPTWNSARVVASSVKQINIMYVSYGEVTLPPTLSPRFFAR